MPAKGANQDAQKRYTQLNDRISELYRQGKYAQAIPLAKEALAIIQKALGSDHAFVAGSMGTLAELYMRTGDYGKAEPLLKKAMAIRKKAHGPNDPRTAAAQNALAAFYQDTGDFSKSEMFYKKALATREKNPGPNHPDTATTLNGLALLYKQLGQYQKAEPLYKRALAIYEKALGPEHPSTAAGLNNLGSLYKAMGQYQQAENYYKQLISIAEKVLGPEHPYTATSLFNLAGLYQQLGDYDSAKKLLKKTLAIRKKALGLNHPETAMAMNGLGVLYAELGDYRQAEPLYKQALGIVQKSLGPDHPATGAALNNLAALYKDLGDYAKAEPLYKKAQSVFEKAYGPEHPETAANLYNIAFFYQDLGDYEQAETLLKKVLAVNEKIYGPKHPETAGCLNKLGGLYIEMGDYGKAEPLCERSLAIRKQVLGPNHSETASAMHNLAAIYEITGRFDKAESLVKKTVAIQEKNLGPDHPVTTASRSNLAGLYRVSGDYAKAESLYTKVLASMKKTFGPDHPNTAVILDNLSMVKAARKDYAAAHDYQMESQKISAGLVDQVMSFTSEDQKLKYLATQNVLLEGAIGLVAFHPVDNKRAVRNVLDMWLGRKGIVLEAQRRYQEALVYSDNAEAVKLFQELAGVRSRLSRLMFGITGGENPAAYNAKVSQLEKEAEELETKLSKMSRTFARQSKVRRADTDKVAKALPANSVLVDFAKVRPFNYQAKGRIKIWKPAHYLAFVLPSGKPDSVSLVDLGEADPINREVSVLKKIMSENRDKSGKKAQRAGEKLYKMVFANLEKHIGRAKDIYISPDDNLNLIPFEVLRSPDDKYLIEKYTFNYLSSGRDLIGFGLMKSESGPPLLMGDPDFSLDDKTRKKTTRELGLRNARSVPASRPAPEINTIRFARLPGTADEVKSIRKILGSKAKLYTGKKALEEILTTQKVSPRILHLATHGFFLTPKQMKEVAIGRMTRFSNDMALTEITIDNPLVRSGLALAGANSSHKAGVSTGGDGLLTAEEVLGLRLQGTDLVVLSACNTGVGEVRSGEGVFGFRRAFIQAGAKGLVMSMWPVPDRETKELMIQFYKNLKSGKTDRCQALRQAVLNQMQTVKERYGNTNPVYWGAFVYLGEPG